MTNTCAVASFVSDRIKVIGKAQKDIAIESGFENPNIITMIKQGKTKLPLSKVGLMAHALETDPILLLELCLSTYQPDTWEAISPFMENAFTSDEVELITKLRAHVGGPYLEAMTEDSKGKFKGFIQSMCNKSKIH